MPVRSGTGLDYRCANFLENDLKKLIFIIVLTALISCSDKKKYIDWQYMFTFEGCKYYKIIVENRFYFLANCDKKVYNDTQEIIDV